MNRFLLLVVLTIGILLQSCSPKLISTESGLEYSYIEKNKKGKSIEEGSQVEAHCILTLADGKKIWSTYDDNRTFKFTYGQTRLIDGFNETVSLLNEGDRVRVTIPSELGYGSKGAGSDIPPDSDLIFDIKVLNVE